MICFDESSPESTINRPAVALSNQPKGYPLHSRTCPQVSVRPTWLRVIRLVWQRQGKLFTRLAAPVGITAWGVHARTNCKTVQADFQRLSEAWNFPLYLCAVDGKHVSVKCPATVRATSFTTRAATRSCFSPVPMRTTSSVWSVLVTSEARGIDGISKILVWKVAARRVAGNPEPVHLSGTRLIHPHSLVGDKAFN